MASTSDSLHSSVGPQRGNRWLRRRQITGGAIGCLAAAAFLIWGPIGLGSEQLTVFAPSGSQILGPQIQVWGMMVPVRAGNSGAVIDRVAVVGGAGYDGPRVLGILEVAGRPGQCGGTWPWQGPESILSTCAVQGVYRLVGAPLPADDPGVDMVIKFGPPGSRSGCWTATAIVVHYHVGIRHYTVVGADDFAACRTATEENNADLALGMPP